MICRYEWVNTASKEGIMGHPEVASHQLELVQHIMLTSGSFAARARTITLLSSPRYTNFAVFGPLRVSVYAPQVPAKRALRLVLKGDMERALLLLQAEVVASWHHPELQKWLQHVIGMAVAHCLRQVCVHMIVSRVGDGEIGYPVTESWVTSRGDDLRN